MKIEYNLVNATEKDVNFLKDVKITTIFDYAKNISSEERVRILNYIDKCINENLKNYKIIKNNNKNCGVFGVRDYEDGILLDEIYLLPKYRNMGIGSDIIKNELEKHKKVYLFVYKDNIRAVNLYKKLGFDVFEDKNERFLMLYKKEV